MIAATLRKLEQLLPSETQHVDTELWKTVSEEFSFELGAVVQHLKYTVDFSFPRRFFNESTEEYLTTRLPSSTVAQYRLRPLSSYFTKMNRHPPYPEDPKGNDATGIEFSVSICRGYSTRQIVRRPFFSIDFQVWGEYERNSFCELLRDHRYLLQQLVRSSGCTFFASSVFENVERSKRASAFQKLLLYYENEIDPENNFSLQNEFSDLASEGDLIRAMLPLLALYDAAMGYCLPKKHRERLIEHSAIVL